MARTILKLTPAILKDWRGVMGITQDEAASLFGMSTRGYGKWEQGASKIPRTMEMLLTFVDPHELLEIVDHRRRNAKNDK